MKHFTFKFRLGFTMLELVMVIVVLGILASLALPRLETDHTQDAADSILSSIRYTQHLAVNDDMHEHNNSTWQRKYWHIVFSSCPTNDFYYIIGSDRDKTGANNALFALNEAAIDPTNQKPMFYTCAANKTNSSKNIFLTDKYGIQNISTSGGCNGPQNGVNAMHIGFDHLGRPHYGFSQLNAPNYASYMRRQCTFTFTMQNNDTFQIQIEPETGYAHIVNQNNS